MMIWAQTFAVTTPDDTSIVVRRDFGAVPTKVWRALTEPEHLRRWLGDLSFPLTTCEMDVRVGGKWRILQRSPDGQEHGFHGEYLEIVRPERLVQTFIYEPFPDNGAVETGTWEALPNGRTRFVGIVRHKTKEGRDGHYRSGVESGVTQAYARLDALLEQLNP